MPYFKPKVSRGRKASHHHTPVSQNHHQASQNQHPPVRPHPPNPPESRTSPTSASASVSSSHLHTLWAQLKGIPNRCRWRNLEWRGRITVSLAAVFSAMVLLPSGFAVATRARGESSVLAWMHTSDAHTALRVYRMETADVLVMPLSDYLVDVLAGEMDAQAPMDALQAAAVAARTYAVHAMLSSTVPQPSFAQARGADVTDDAAIDLPWLTAANQELKFKSQFDTYTIRLQQAVQSTDGQVLIYHGQPISAFTFRLSPGQTRDAKDVIGKEIPYLKSVPCPDDGILAKTSTVTLTAANIVDDLQLGSNNVNAQGFHVTSTDKLGFVRTVTYGNRTWNGQDFARLLNLPSSHFQMKAAGGGLTFTVQGIGDDVGMSLHEAQVMAGNQKSWRDILGVFYSGTQLANDQTLLQAGAKP